MKDSAGCDLYNRGAVAEATRHGLPEADWTGRYDAAGM